MAHTSHQPKPIVVAHHRGDPVLLEPAARLRHVHVLGQTGSGKSSLLANLIGQDIAAGHGLALIDPHGSLASIVLSLIPTAQDYAHQVIYLRAADREFPIGFNLLDRVPDDQQARVAGDMVAAFVHIWGETAVGDRSQQVLRNSLRVLMDSPPATLLSVPRLLTDDTFRARVVERARDPVVRAYWRHQFDGYDRGFRNQVTAPILNKLDQLLSDPLLRNILGQHRRTLDIRRVMDSGQILIADLAGLDETSTYVLGALLTTTIAQAALSRADTPERERRPFYLYADEFPAYASAGFETILSQARKYALGLTLGHQLVGQLTDNMRQAVLGNSGSFISFRVGAEDADLVARHLGLEPDTDYTGLGRHETAPPQRLLQLPNFFAWGRFLERGRPSAPILLEMAPEPAPINHRPHRIMALSQASFGCPRAKVEANIRKFLEGV